MTRANRQIRTSGAPGSRPRTFRAFGKSLCFRSPGLRGNIGGKRERNGWSVEGDYRARAVVAVETYARGRGVAVRGRKAT